MFMLFNKDWRFSKDEFADAYNVNFDDTNWRVVNLPHDYAIEGPFSKENDKQIEKVDADGVIEPIIHVARSGGLPVCDKAWYRKTFTLPSDCENVFLEFDGIMSRSTVYVNGKKCGGRIYGYTSFSVDITEACNKGVENIVAVFVDPENSSSRWYSGAGIYRDVRLMLKPAAYFPFTPTYITTVEKDNVAKINWRIDVISYNSDYEIIVEIKDANGNILATDKGNFCGTFSLSEYINWDVLNSYLYTFSAKLYISGSLVDEYETKFGIRSIKFDKDKGFILNGKRVELKGLCMHHDLGPLGAIANKSGIRRQLTKLIEMGANAIRTSHNPPAPQLLDLCDELGLVVIDEAFDEWKHQKLSNSYGKYFDEWGKEDLTAMIKRDVNHPCVIMWSIGNEILEQSYPDGWKLTKYLTDICHLLDPSRAVTMGFNNIKEAFENSMYKYVDIIGLNYEPHYYGEYKDFYPDGIFYGSETSSCISSRGEYFMPADISIPAVKRENLQINSYDLDAPPWANYPEREFFAQDKFDFLFGEFVWTGFDYLGEPTPYRSEWPSRSSYFGIFDLVGMKKDRYYSYKAKWTDEDVMHLFPHWNWNEGDIVDVHCYSNYDEVELFLNGKSMGISVKNPEDEIRKYRHIWTGIEYKPGEIKAVAVNNPDIYEIVKTAKKEAKLILKPEQNTLIANGEDLLYIECSVVDEDGVFCPKSNIKVEFCVEGAAMYVAADNGNATDTRVFSEKYCNMYNGKCMGIIRSIEGVDGEVRITAVSGDMSATCIVKSE